MSEVQVNIYTPRSGSGIPISLSPKLESPKNFGEMLQNDPTLAFEILELTSSTLLKLVGYSGEERVQLSFISEILKTYWSMGKLVRPQEVRRAPSRSMHDGLRAFRAWRNPGESEVCLCAYTIHS